MAEKTIVPPIKSQGIKTKLIPWIKSFIDDDMKEGRWIEPFMGTSVVAFNMKFEKAIVADINPHIVEFYNELKNKEITPKSVREFLEHEGEILKNAEENGYAHYRSIRDRFNKSGKNPLDFLFLSRAGFNGMVRFNKKGEWNIPFCRKPNRFSKAYITKIVNQTSAVFNVITENWQFHYKDFREVIQMASENDIIYCDPPYYGRYVDYYNGWTEKDENDLYTLLKGTKAKFILSTWHHNDFRENEMIEKFWNEFNIETKEHFYHAGGKVDNRNPVIEALVYNFDKNEIKKSHHSAIEHGLLF
ncbi:MAG: DNA adenine methylase [Spirochaeta sp. LUC14_002_19_P3]|nr:MAG: DNA adenine methylase [Spirochaeta sp. LUC14_002_19_P3]